MTDNRESEALFTVPAEVASENVTDVAAKAEEIEVTAPSEVAFTEAASAEALVEKTVTTTVEATVAATEAVSAQVEALFEEEDDLSEEDDDLSEEEAMDELIVEPETVQKEPSEGKNADGKNTEAPVVAPALESPAVSETAPVQMPSMNTDVFGQTSYDNEPPVIVFEGVHKEYEGQVADSVALTDVSFSINKGEFVFIVGPSGSGKSTMIRLMMREIAPSGGKIYIAGKELAKLRRGRISKYRRNIGIVFQDFRLLPDRSVFDNVAFAQRVVGAPRRKIPKEVSKVLHLVGLSQKYKSFPNELSGGEQQRVAIARALVNNPMIILADEPTGNLDPQNSQEIMSLLEEINRRGTTVVIVTHDREVVDKMQKRVIMLNGGTIVEDKKGGYGRG